MSMNKVSNKATGEIATKPALIDLPLAPMVATQLNSNRDETWCEYERNVVTDVIAIGNNPYTIVVNKDSDKSLGIQVSGAFDGKSVIYSAFSIVLGEYAIFMPGYHETKINKLIARSIKPFRYRMGEDGKWHCFRLQNKAAVEIRFKDAKTPYELYLRDNYQNLHDMTDMVIQGAYCEIDLSSAIPLYEFFLSLLAMDPETAKATISEHESQKIAFSDAYNKSKEIKPEEINDEFEINGNSIDAEVVVNMDFVVATNPNTGYSRKVAGKHLAYLTQLAKDGYLLTTS